MSEPATIYKDELIEIKAALADGLLATEQIVNHMPSHKNSQGYSLARASYEIGLEKLQNAIKSIDEHLWAVDAGEPE